MAQNNTALYLLSFNNYYNRIVKRFDTVEEYMGYSVYTPLVCNFNPADGIDTEHIFNIATLQVPPSADYVLAVNENNEIVSRWFIVNASRVRGGQFRLALHRDLVADFKTDIITAPCYIERAMVNVNNKLIFNQENMLFNQIKKKEVLLKDKSQCAWIVGYLAKNYYEGISYTPEPPSTDPTRYYKYIDFSQNTERDATIQYSYTKLQNLISLNSGKLFSNVGTYQSIWIDCSVLDEDHGIRLSNQAPGGIVLGHETANDTSFYTEKLADAEELGQRIYNSDYFWLEPDELDDYIPSYVQPDLVDELISLDGQYIKNTDATGPRYFSVSFKTVSTVSGPQYVPPVNSAYYRDIKRWITDLVTDDAKYKVNRNLNGKFYWGTNGTNPIKITATGATAYQLSVSNQAPLVNGRAYLGDKADAKATAINLPYTVFAMPYGTINAYKENVFEFTCEPGISLNVASAISSALGGGGESSYIYDLQLLPFCPIPGIINEAGKIDLTNSAENNYGLVKQVQNGVETDNIGIILFVDKPSFSFSIPLAEPITAPTDATQFKIDNETKFCRLVSPNYAGAFEFKPTKNGGFSTVEINCSYKPYQPYIHINPLFNNGYMYGGDFNDNRGLICGGDFSLPQTSEAWKTFQIQNKSYMESFNRQIENMDVNYSIERTQMEKAGASNVITSGVSGATAGGMAGSVFGPAGTAVGAMTGFLAGAGASMIGLNADLEAVAKQHNEARSYTMDQFNLSLQNIKALPNTMSRTSAFDINNKLFPFIEFYEATDEEVDALRNKITYNSMAVNVISNISTYMKTTPTFIQGSIIRLPSLEEDYHLAVAIAQEIHKGVYI